LLNILLLNCILNRYMFGNQLALMLMDGFKIRRRVLNK